MAIKKNKKKNPDRVTHTMKQMYINRANAIRTKIARRQAWAEEWSEKIQHIEADMKMMEIAESEAITDLKLQLETTQILETETSSTIHLVEAEIEENHLKYKHEIARLEVEKIEGVREKTAEVSMLAQKEQEIRFFMANQTELYTGLTARQEKMNSSENEQQEKLIKIQESRIKRAERLTKEIETKMQIFAETLRKSIKVGDLIYEENAHLRERNLYISSQIREMRGKIPETQKRIKELIGERKECVKKWSWEVPRVGKNLALEGKVDLERLKCSVGSQTEDVVDDFEEVEEISANRIKAGLNAIKKLTNEARALVLIPRAGLPEEARLNDEEVHLRYMQRRDFIMMRRQCILELIQEVLQHGKPDYQDPTATPEQATPSPEPTPEESDDSQTESLPPSTSTSLPRSPTPTQDSFSDIHSLDSLSWDDPFEE